MSKSVIILGYRHTVESPRTHCPEAELWGQSNGIRAWDWSLYDWSRWFDIHTLRPQGDYAGIQMLRPDIFLWYQRQGPERPIYLAEPEPTPNVRASVPYPRAQMEAEFGAGHFGCQMDYMVALALHEGFDRIIFYGAGWPYVGDPTSKAAEKWYRLHKTVLWWIRLARSRGVDVVLDGPSMLHPDIHGNDDPPEDLLPGAYGYEMGPGGLPNGLDVER